MKKQTLLLSGLLFSAMLTIGLTSCDNNKNSSSPASSSSSSSSVAPLQTFTVTFDLNGGNINGSISWPSQTVEIGHWATKPPVDPVKTNTTFDGWFSGSTKWEFTNPIYGDVNLVAHYTVNPDALITIYVDPNNGQSVYPVETFVGDVPRITIPNHIGYSFAGWYFKDTDERFTGTIQPTHNGRTIYAKWEQGKFDLLFQIEDNEEITITGIRNLEATNIVIPSVIDGRTVTAIGEKAFQDRVYLLQVTIPATVKTISSKAFNGARMLNTITVDPTNPYYEDLDGVLFTKGRETLVLYPAKHGTTYTVPATVKKIGDYAFYYHRDSGISTIFFQEGLEEIGDYAFYSNWALASLKFPSTLRRIGNSAFNALSASYGAVLQNVQFNEGLEVIGESAFVGAYFKDALTLPSTIKEIGAYAFANCTAITDFTFPRDLETLGNNSFAGATGLLRIYIEPGNTNFKVKDNLLYTSNMKKVVLCPSGQTDKVTIEPGTEEIGDYAFYMVDACQEYDIPSSLTRIGKYAFAHCYDLKSFTIPNSVTELGESVFDTCEDLTTVVLGTGITEIPEYAFADCTSLKNIEFPSNIKRIGDDAFFGCPSLEKLDLPEGLEEIGNAAFFFTSPSNEEFVVGNFAAKIKSIVFPDTLKTIGNRAFCKQSALTTVQFGNQLESIGTEVFAETGLTSIMVSESNPNLVVDNNILYNKAKTRLFFAAPNVSGDVTFPSTLKTIDSYAFYDARNISNLSFPNSLEEIGEGAFYFTKAESATFGTGLKKIGDGAFFLSYIKTVSFSEGLEEIGQSAFHGSDIEAAALPNSLKTIGETAFSTCLQLTSLTLGNGIETIGERAFQNCPRVTGNLVLPDALNSIGDGAFMVDRLYGTDKGGFTNFIINNNSNFVSENGLLMNTDKTIVYSYARGYNQSSVSLNTTVVEVRPYAFTYVTKLTGLMLNNGLERIGNNAFSGMINVSVINVPVTVTYIGKEAFSGWGYSTSQTINFGCSEDYALKNYDQYYANGIGSSALVRYGQIA